MTRRANAAQGDNQPQRRSRNPPKPKPKPIVMQSRPTSNKAFNRSPGAVQVPLNSWKDRKQSFRVASGSKPGSIRISGCDFMATVPWNSGSVAGTTLANLLLCPGAGLFSNTRLGKFASLYEKYVFRNLEFHVQSQCAATQTGAYILCYDRDVSDPTPPANTDAIRQFLAHDGARAGACWESVSIKCPLADNQTFFYTSPASGGDERLVYQGQLYLAVMNAVSSNQSVNLWVDYDIELMDPQLEIPLVEGKQTASTGTSSSTPKAAWNTATSATVASANVPFITDSGGNKGFRLPPGNWLLEQALKYSSAGGDTIIGSTVLDALTGTDVTANTLTLLDSAFAALSTNANANGWRSEKVINPGPDDVIVYGSLINGGGTISSQMVRVVELAGQQIL